MSSSGSTGRRRWLRANSIWFNETKEQRETAAKSFCQVPREIPADDEVDDDDEVGFPRLRHVINP